MKTKKEPKKQVNFRLDIKTLIEMRYLMDQNEIKAINSYFEKIINNHFRMYIEEKGISYVEAYEEGLDAYERSLTPETEEAAINNERVLKKYREKLKIDNKV